MKRSIKNITVQTVISAFLSLSLVAGAVVASESHEPKRTERTTATAAYNPNEVYDGRYLPTRLFYKHSHLAGWRTVQGGWDNYQAKVTCAAARKALDTDGIWQGYLNTDGSCRASSGDPVIFAIGNRINFDRSHSSSSN